MRVVTPTGSYLWDKPKIASLIVLLAFDKRDVATLTSVIEELILPGITIVSGKLKVNTYILLPQPPP